MKAIVPDSVNNAIEIVGAATLKDTLKAVRAWGQVVVVGLLSGPPVLESFNLMGDLPGTVKPSFFSSGLLSSELLPLKESLLNSIADQIARSVRNFVSIL